MTRFAPYLATLCFVGVCLILSQTVAQLVCSVCLLTAGIVLVGCNHDR